MLRGNSVFFVDGIVPYLHILKPAISVSLDIWQEGGIVSNSSISKSLMVSNFRKQLGNGVE